MNSKLNSIPENYWEDFSIEETDLEFIYNHLLELEIPQDTDELVQALIGQRIHIEKQKLLDRQQDRGKIYFPREAYASGDTILFPQSGWQTGTVISSRRGNNPEIEPFSVIDVEFSNGEKIEFASELNEHALNNTSPITEEDELLNEDVVFKKFSKRLQELLNEELRSNPDLVQIAGKWFPRALLVDVNVGYLNLAEAVLEEAGGGPLPTVSILEQIDFPTDVNANLTEFSINLALQEDGRFDEVGPTGEVLWFLRRLEPQDVQTRPLYLNYDPINYDPEPIKNWLKSFESIVYDELQPTTEQAPQRKEISISITYPHWRAGTLPLCREIRTIFPSALESPRIRFAYVDADSGQRISGWVVRPFNYVSGLREWYIEQGIFPGAVILIRKSQNPGEIIISAQKHRSNREWMRTLLIGADGGVVFAVLKQLVSVNFDERMAVAIPDLNALDQLWSQNSQRKPHLETAIINIMKELSKLSPQGHVHAQELYAAVNTIRRLPPGPILNILRNSQHIKHLGDLYFRIVEEVDPEEVRDE